MTKIIIPDSVQKVLEFININGYKAYIVGGAIRDNILGKTPTDYDITTNADISTIKEIFKYYKIFETGLKHNTITLRINKENYEITTFRGSDINSLEEDLLLRDFTINSLALDINGNIIDVSNGLEDLTNKLIRINGNDDSVIIADPLRILRAIRLASNYDFTIEKQTEEYMFKNRELLNSVSRERISDELSKIIVNRNSYKYIEDYFSIFSIVIPQLIPMKGFNQNNPHHMYDVLIHSLYVLKNIRNRSDYLCLAALFHDIGKPSTFKIDNNGIGHFYGHEEVGMNIAKKILKELKYDNETIRKIALLIKYHDFNIESKKTIKRLLNEFGEELIFDLYDLKQSDIRAHTKMSYYRLDILKKTIKDTKEIIKQNECFQRNDLSINGRDLIELGIEPGNKYKIIFDDILTRVINDDIKNDREVIIDYIKDTYL